jgi:hypothetical protein
MRIVTFYGMLIYITLCGLCLANEWNAFINSQNNIVKSIENVTTYKKKIPLIFAIKKSGCYSILFAFVTRTSHYQGA